MYFPSHEELDFPVNAPLHIFAADGTIGRPPADADFTAESAIQKLKDAIIPGWGFTLCTEYANNRHATAISELRFGRSLHEPQ